MRDTTNPEGSDPKMTLLAIKESYWLYEGTEFLRPMLYGEGYFPTPIKCLVFENAFELKMFMQPGEDIGQCWGINPDIVERLRREDQLVEVRASEL